MSSVTHGRAVSASVLRDSVSWLNFSPHGLAIPSQALGCGGINGSRLQTMLLWCCCSEVIFRIIERDIKRFMVYSYRRCSGRRSVEIDTAVTAGLVTGCDSHMLHETKVEVAGGVPPVRRAGRAQACIWARRCCSSGGAGDEMPGRQSCTRLSRALQRANKEIAVGLSVLQSTNVKRKKSNLRSAMRARMFYKICLSLLSSLWICPQGKNCGWSRVCLSIVPHFASLLYIFYSFAS